MFVGHKKETGCIQPLKEHLEGVANLAEEFANSFDGGEFAFQMGLSHDIGKYSKAFQHRILDGGPKVDHSSAGGQEIYKLHGAVAAYGVLGHHGGLMNGGSPVDMPGGGTLYSRLKKENIHDYCWYKNEVELLKVAFPPLKPLENVGFSVSFLTRMLFSCLVDADFIDTENFMSDETMARGGRETVSELYEKLIRFTEPFKQGKGRINLKRNEILAECIEQAENTPGLFSLTVPTGGGKTISSLAFALGHAKKYGLRRVIYVIPYTSIIEQNASVFAEILGEENVLEHHSNIQYDNDDLEDTKKYLATENWDAPIIVTTNVQFFESLFAARTSSCRKLHNLAQSVIVFDEAQMLPVSYLYPCIRVIAELVHNYHCSAVLCTATQPALESFFPKELTFKEICSNRQELYEFFRRTTIINGGDLSDDNLVAKIKEHKQVLCIVNTRRQAINLFKALPEKGSYHLSTLMYPEHRKRVLEEIRQCLKEKKVCRVIATSLVEAGVDIDFPVVYRAKAGLDSIIQAAGRCNREGNQERRDSKVIVFAPETTYKIPTMLQQTGAIFDMVARKYEDLSNPKAIHAYFKQMYYLKGEDLDAKKIVPRFEKGYINGWSFPFADVAKDFTLIEQETYTVFIPKEYVAKELDKQLQQRLWNRNILRKIGLYSVNIYGNHLQELLSLGMVEPADVQNRFYILRDLAAYDDQCGLPITLSSGHGIFIDV